MPGGVWVVVSRRIHNTPAVAAAMIAVARTRGHVRLESGALVTLVSWPAPTKQRRARVEMRPGRLFSVSIDQVAEVLDDPGADEALSGARGAVR